MGTLYAHREQETWFNVVTNLKTFDGKVKKSLLGQQNQLRKGTKTIVINKESFLIDWSKFKN